EKYRLAARSVYARLERQFWMSDIALYRTTAGVDDRMQFTPVRFGVVFGALRQYFKLVASAPSRKPEADQILARIKRLFKLVVNGWNDRNQDDSIQYPEECLDSRLQMGERALTGELGHMEDQG